MKSRCGLGGNDAILCDSRVEVLEHGMAIAF